MSSALFRKSVEEIFSSATLTLERTNSDATHSDDANSKDDQCQYISTYFVDTSSQRADVVLPVIIHFENEFERQRLIQSEAVQPPPSARHHYDIGCNNNRQKNDPVSGANIGIHNENDSKEEEYQGENQEDMWDAELDMIGETQDDDFALGNRSAIQFECLVLNNQDTENKNGVSTVIESVQILSTFLVDTESDVGIGFDVEISLRCDSLPCEQEEVSNNRDDDSSISHKANRVHTRFELRALLHSSMEIDPSPYGPNSAYSSFSWNRSRMMGHQERRNNSMAMNLDISLGLQALDMGLDAVVPALGGDDLFVSDTTSATNHEKDISTSTRVYTLPPKTENAPCIQLDIAPAMYITAHEFHTTPTSCSDGNTLVSLTLEHSNAHDDDVMIITNISLHTSHSRVVQGTDDDDKIHRNNVGVLYGGEDATMDMTPHVQWEYLPGTAPSLPLVLQPGDAHSTILKIRAEEVDKMERGGRDFVSPIVVRGIVEHRVGINGNRRSSRKVMACVDARWRTTASVVNDASGSVDALEVGVSVEQAICKVGKQVVVRLKVMNLGDEVKDLKMEVKNRGHAEKVVNASSSMLEVEQKHDNENSSRNISDPNPIVIQDGEYKFGCYGLEGYNNGMIEYDSFDGLLAVDDTLHLGEIQGQESVESELRFIPLKEGTLTVPNFNFFDRSHDKWYPCDHSLKIIAVPTSQ